MIDIDLLRQLGWEAGLIDEVNRIASALDRQSAQLPIWSPADTPAQSGSVMYIDPTATANAGTDFKFERVG